MGYWLTVHWPLRVDEAEDVQWRNWVFIAEGWEGVGRDIGPGDRVFVYETQTTPRVREGRRFVDRRPGRKGIIAVARVTTPLRDNPNAEVEELEDGRRRRWRFHAETETEAEGLLPLEEVRNAMNKPGFSARIPGGLMRLNPQQFNRILRRFNRTV